MLDKLKELVKHYAGEPIINNPDIPNERNEEAVEEASNSIFSGLKNAVSGGNLSGLTSMFGSGDAAGHSEVSKNIQSGFVENLMHKFGLDHGKASQIAGSLIPSVLSKLSSKTNDPTDNSFDLEKMITSLTGGTNGGGGSVGGGLVDKVKGLFK